MAELPDAKKWFTGFVDVTRWIKDAGTLLRLIVITIVVFVLVVGGIALWKRWIPKKQPKTTIESVARNAKVDASTDKKCKFGLLNIF